MSPAAAATEAERKQPRKIQRVTREERVAKGKEARARLPREAHAEVVLDGRPDPVGLLESQAAARVTELVPIRYGRMSTSPFAFYRGAALVMATDLAAGQSTGLKVQLCGDAHMSNFGVFGSPERNLLFDINDFDETAPGSFEWDVKRLAASLEIAGRSKDLGHKHRRRIVRAAVASYREAMREFADLGNLDVWYARLDLDRSFKEIKESLSVEGARRTKAALAKARTRDSMTALSKLTTEVDGQPRILGQPPLIETIETLFPGEDLSLIHI